jgi:hypothetical protein
MATIKKSQGREHHWQDIGYRFTANERLVTGTRHPPRIPNISKIYLLENSRKER